MTREGSDYDEMRFCATGKLMYVTPRCLVPFQLAEIARNQRKSFVQSKRYYSSIGVLSSEKGIVGGRLSVGAYTVLAIPLDLVYYLQYLVLPPLQLPSKQGGSLSAVAAAVPHRPSSFHPHDDTDNTTEFVQQRSHSGR